MEAGREGERKKEQAKLGEEAEKPNETTGEGMRGRSAKGRSLKRVKKRVSLTRRWATPTHYLICLSAMMPSSGP